MPDLAGRQRPSIVECPSQRRSAVGLQPAVGAGLASDPVVERVAFKNLQKLLCFQGGELGHGATLNERAGDAATGGPSLLTGHRARRRVDLPSVPVVEGSLPGSV